MPAPQITSTISVPQLANHPDSTPATDDAGGALSAGAAGGSKSLKRLKQRVLVTHLLESWWMLCPFMGWAVLIISFYAGAGGEGGG
jgi:hypothetical protein